MTSVEYEAMVTRNLNQVVDIVRQAKGINAQDFALSIGMKPKLMHNKRTGHSLPTAYQVYLMNKKYGITADWIFLQDRSNLPEWVRVRLRDDML